jgi:hypothetical protein
MKLGHSLSHAFVYCNASTVHEPRERQSGRRVRGDLVFAATGQNVEKRHFVPFFISSIFNILFSGTFEHQFFESARDLWSLRAVYLCVGAALAAKELLIPPVFESKDC